MQENKNNNLSQNIEVDVIFNRFDLRYDDYELFYAAYKYIPAKINQNTLKLGLYYRELSQKDLTSFCDDVFINFPNINYIEVENTLTYNDDLMPNLLHFVDLKEIAEIKTDFINQAKKAGERLQKEQGDYKIISTEKPARNDKTTEETELGPDDPPFKPRLKNMDIIQLQLNDKTEAMLLVSKTGENVVFEHITSNHNYSKTYDIELILCTEVVLKFLEGGFKKIFLNGTTTELKRRLYAKAVQTYSGKIWRKNKLYKLVLNLVKLPIKIQNMIVSFVSLGLDKETKKDFQELINTRNSDNYKLLKHGVWFDFYETKEDSDFSSYEYFNHETSKNYINTVIDLKIPFKKKQSFMDIGCGTGYVMHKMAPFFKNVYGIEIEDKWVNIAKSNFMKLGITNYEILQQDINHIDESFFDKADVFYLFNPFIGATMRGVVNKIASSFKRKPRKGWVIYINALNRSMFDNNDIFKIYKEFESNNRRHVVYQI